VKIIVGALSAIPYTDRRERCRKTWVPKVEEFGHQVVFLCGGLPDDRDRVLNLGVPDDYPSLPQKTFAFCQWALRDQSWDFLFKCDDDTYICAERFHELAKALKGHDYIGAEWKPGVGYASGGAGYFLSRRAAKAVVGRMSATRGSEDVEVGRAMAKAEIPFHIDDRLIPFSQNGVPHHNNDLVTSHAMDAATFLGVHKSLYPDWTRD
jgi:hypothetical protein